MSFIDKIFKCEKRRTIPDNWQMPVAGDILSLDKVLDSAFASGSLGAGFAIHAVGDEILSPVDGVVSELFSTLHAVFLLADNGLEVLIHIGIDTVSLQGRGFTALVSQGEAVHVGQALVRVDWEVVKAAGLSTLVPVIFTNAPGQDVEVSQKRPYFV